MTCIATPSPAIFSALGADPDLAELVELFVSEIPSRIAVLREDYQQARWEQLGRTAHQLKGAAGSYGFHQLTPYAASLETAVRSGAPEQQILQHLEALAALCGRLQAGVPAGS